MCIDIVGDCSMASPKLCLGQLTVVLYHRILSWVFTCNLLFLCKLDHIRLHILLPSFLVHLVLFFLCPNRASLLTPLPLLCSLIVRFGITDNVVVLSYCSHRVNCLTCIFCTSLTCIENKNCRLWIHFRREATDLIAVWFDGYLAPAADRISRQSVWPPRADM